MSVRRSLADMLGRRMADIIADPPGNSGRGSRQRSRRQTKRTVMRSTPRDEGDRADGALPVTVAGSGSVVTGPTSRGQSGPGRARDS